MGHIVHLIDHITLILIILDIILIGLGDLGNKLLHGANMATLTEVLKDIGEEIVEININGEEIQCTRTEAAARRLFLLATGGYMQTKDENNQTITTYFKPTASACKAIREYTEGRASQEPPKEGKRNSKAGQFDGSIAGRLNKLVNNGTTPTKT